MTLRNSSTPNFRPPRSLSSITASLSVCMCTAGVSLYSSTASHPLSLFTTSPPLRRRLYNLFGPDQRPVSVNLVEEQSDCRGHRPGAGSIGHVEGMAGARQFHIAHHRARDRPQPLDETAGLLHRNDGVAGAMDDQERRGVAMDARHRRRLAEDVGMPGELASDHDP